MSSGRANDSISGIGLQTDGKIVVGGTTFNGTSEDFALARYNPNGSLDSTFGTGGKTTIALGANDFATAVAIQPDGRIVVAGNTSDLVHTNFALVRLHGRAPV